MEIKPQPSWWRQFTGRLKPFQKRWNDWLLTPLAILVFLQLPTWVNKLVHGAEFHPFSADTLMALPTALVLFCFASLGAYGMFRIQYPDMYDEFTRCNEQDLLKKQVRSDAITINDTDKFISPSEHRHAWRIHTASQSILFHYFWALVLLQAVIAATVPTLP